MGIGIIILIIMILSIVLFASIANNSLEFGVICALIIIGLSVWIFVAFDQTKINIHKGKITTLEKDKIYRQVVINREGDSFDLSGNIVDEDKCEVTFYQYIPMSKGINWGNGDIWKYDVNNKK